MEFIQEIRVLYSDTDSYGVVWHGAYTKWFEAARVGLVEQLGLELEALEKSGIVFPVVEIFECCLIFRIGIVTVEKQLILRLAG